MKVLNLNEWVQVRRPNYTTTSTEDGNFGISPKTKEELQSIIKERIKKEGPNCDLNDIDVSGITDMSDLFNGSIDHIFAKFNGDISEWDVSNVTNMSGMFFAAMSFNRPIGYWNVSKVTDMSYMFAHAKSFNQDISEWDVSHVKRMDGMFREAESFNKPIGKWDVRRVRSITDMFRNASKFNQDLSEWDFINLDMKYIDEVFWGSPLQNKFKITF